MSSRAWKRPKAKVFQISIIAKLIIPLCILSAILTYLAAAVVLSLFEAEQVKSAQNNALANASQAVMDFDSGVSLNKLRNASTNLALDRSVMWAAVIDSKSDRILASSSAPLKQWSLVALSEQMLEAYRQAKLDGLAHITPILDHKYALAYPVNAIDETQMNANMFVLVIQYDSFLIDEQFERYKGYIIISSLSFFVALTVVLFALVHLQVRKPLLKFKGLIDSERVDGKFRPINVNTNDEFGALARAYNRMMAVENKSMQKAKDAKVAAQQLADKKAQFLANMSHELRTPINGILGLSQLCERSDDIDEVKQYLRQLSHSSHILLSVVNDILDFSRLNENRTELHTEQVVLSELIYGIANLVQVSSDEKALAFSAFISPNCPYEIDIDKKRVQQILMNISNNAVKFTNSGAIRVTVDYLSQANDINTVVNPSENTMYGELIFAVEDTGIGISEEHIAKLFDPFEQADTSISRNFGGSGLGLAICKELAELMGGSIHIKSKLKQGSCFTVRIPCKGVSLKDRLNLLKNKKIDSAHIPTISYTKELNSRTNRVCESINKIAQLHPVIPLSKITDSHKRPPYILDEKVLLEYISDYRLGEQNNRPTDDTKASAQQSKNYKILLVEDNEINATVAQAMLIQESFDVVIAENGEVAVQMALEAAQKDESFDLVLMDIQMPVMDGIEATKAIKQSLPYLPIIALSANVMDEDEEKAFEVGMSDYLHKPIVRAKLISCISKHLKVQEKTKLKQL